MFQHPIPDASKQKNVIKNEAGPEFQLPKDMSNAGATGPKLQFPNTKTNTISSEE